MPYNIRKVSGKNCYKVVNKDNGRIHAKCTSLKKAKSQLRLLYGIDSGWKPRRIAQSHRKSKMSKRRLVRKGSKRMNKRR